MAQRTPDEETTLDQVLKLVDKLTPEDQGRLIDYLDHLELKREIQIGIDDVRAGRLVDGEEAFAKLKERYRSDK